MVSRKFPPSAVLSAAAAALVLSLVQSTAFAQSFGSRATSGKCPYGLPPGEVSMEIAEIKYVDRVEGQGGVTLKVPPDRLNQFRIAFVTIRVKKPAGKAITVAAADLTLHYNHGGSQEVAPCEGISTFSKNLDDERPLTIYRQSGPGWVKQTTSLRSTEATEVYFDALFHLIEPEIREVWLCVAQPTTERGFLTSGWQR